MDLSLNETQLAVLKWIGAGPDLDDPPTPAFKTSAIALRSRGLIELDRRRGRWNAVIVAKGEYYLEHGKHPDAAEPPSAPKQPRGPVAAHVKPKREPAPPANEPTAATTTTPTNTGAAANASIPIPAQIRNAHAAIREIVDHKSRVDVPTDSLRRAHLILNALVQEALRRDWTVTPVLSSMRADTWTGKRERVWPSDNLFSIDAGSAPAAVRLRMRQRKVDHVPTKEDIAHEERYGYRRHPKHDFVPTDKMRLEIGAGAYGSLVIEDTVATRIEDKLERAFDRIQSMTNDAIARAEAQRQYAIEEAERRRRAEAMRVRAVHYGKWASALDDLHAAFTKHQELGALVTSLRGRTPDTDDPELQEQFERYLEWAEQHLQESDPLITFALPEGETPDLSYSQWQRWRFQNQHLFANGRFG